jgi:hypothetical protein
VKWQQCREQACFSTKRDSAWIAAIFGVLVVLGLVVWFSDWSHPTNRFQHLAAGYRKPTPQ